MSRFIIMPSIKTFDLIPIDRENTKRVIEISDAIVVDMGVFHRVEDQDNLKSLLCKLSRAGKRKKSGKKKEKKKKKKKKKKKAKIVRTICSNFVLIFQF